MFYVVSLSYNSTGIYSQSIEKYESEKAAKSRYHEKLKNVYQSSSIVTATVEILGSQGEIIYPWAESVNFPITVESDDPKEVNQ